MDDASTAKPIDPPPPPHGKTPLKCNGEIQTRSQVGGGSTSQRNGETQKRSHVGSGSASQKKNLFRWSFQDELTVLHGLLEYKDKHRCLPSYDMSRFLDLIRGSLQEKVSNTQLGGKVWHLKKKFMTASARIRSGRPAFTRGDHDFAVYELSKKIWPEIALPEAEFTEESESDGATRDVNAEHAHYSDGATRDENAEHAQDSNCATSDVNAEHAQDNLEFPYLSQVIKKMDKGTLSGLGIKRTFELVDPKKAARLEKKLKTLQLKRMRLQLEEIDLVKESMRLQLKEMDLVKESIESVVDSLAAME